MKNHESWGRYPRLAHRKVVEPFWPDEIPALFGTAEGSVLPFGSGRSYGDVCLNEGGTLLATRHLNRFRHFDEAAGVLTCEAGVTLRDVLDFIVPRGWFLPVVPGTKEISVGGAIANDVHGKNHHRAGTFGCLVRSMEILRSDRTIQACSPDSNAPLFRATIGGMGLTGLIVSATINLKRLDGPWIEQETIRFGSLDEFFAISRESDASHEYTVAWVDCIARGAALGRGVFYRGNFSPRNDQVRRRHSLPPVPIDAPGWLLAPAVMKTFNSLYYHGTRQQRATRVVHYEQFFFPLDSLPAWNRLYGQRGFLQHQCVVPFESGASAIREILERVVRSGNASFLAVLKTFGCVVSPGLMSFPRPGVTLAMDFRFSGAKTLQLLDDLDGIVRAVGGALYAAKDARMTAETFRLSNPSLDAFRDFVDPEFSSSLWRRVNT